MLSVLLVGVESRLFGEAALRHVDFLRGLFLNGVAPTQQGVTTPGDEEGVPANAYIYVFVLWGGSCEEATTHFLQVAQ